jgi:hypothetical protein
LLSQSWQEGGEVMTPFEEMVYTLLLGTLCTFIVAKLGNALGDRRKRRYARTGR